MSGKVTVLVPARNAAQDIPGLLESAALVGERVIALDDGSTDETARLLEASPLVERVLRNPRRETYAGWDDATNRQRLLDAATESGPCWVLFLDADERLDPDDAQALREFVGGDALPGLAYGLQMYRAWEDRVAPDPSYVYRLFFAVGAEKLSEQALHFNPVPRGLPRSAWVRTTIRARHLESEDRLTRRRRKYEEADPDGSWDGGRTPLDGPDVLVEWEPRPRGLAVLAVGAEGERASMPTAESRGITVLVPARNAAQDIPGLLESAALVGERVIALDDGSTDETARLLEASPLVERVLRNPRRETYAGWDDAANRQRLLDAATESGPCWVLFLDADERLDPDDAQALREFAPRAADASGAYGFRVFRMIADTSRFDRAELWVYRLFEAMPGASLPTARLHFVPVPEEIPRERWRKTTIRIQHLSSITPQRRQARLAKYRQADPDRRWQRDYSSLVEVGPPRAWVPRPPGMPVLADPLEHGVGSELDLAELDPSAPLLSAIVISRDNAATIERTVRAVVAQECPEPFEVIVAASGSDGTADIARRSFPGVTVIDVAEPGLPGAARNAGLAVARGDYVSFPGSHVELPPGSLAARMTAHDRGYTMVTGSVVNGTHTRSGWAAYFLDHSGSLPGRPSGELDATPAHCSYTREALLEVGGFPEDMRAGEDTVVNGELWRRGHTAYRDSAIVLTHRNRSRRPWHLARHHFVRGRAFGRILLGRYPGGSPRRRSGVLSFLAGYPRWRMETTGSRVRRWGDELREEYRRARPLVVLGALAAGAGACFQVLLSRRGGVKAPGAGRGEGSPLPHVDHH